jgi:hypothetical protein
MTIAGNCSQSISTANVSTLIAINDPTPKLKTISGEASDGSSQGEVARLKKQTLVYPNPFNGRITIQYTVEKEESITKFEIYDLQGRLVQSLFDQKKARGVYNETFEVGNLPSQVYVIRTCIDGTCINNKLVRTIE